MTDKKLTELTLLAASDIDWANDLIYIVDKSATTSGSKAIALANLLSIVNTSVNIATINGIDYSPGSDTDCTLVTVDVSGSPTMQWDESNDMFYFSKGLNTEGGLYVSNAAGTVNIATVNGIDLTPGSDVDCDLLTIAVTGTPKLWWDESGDAFVFSEDLEADNFRTATALGGQNSTAIGENVLTLGGTCERSVFIGSLVAYTNAVNADVTHILGCDNVLIGAAVARALSTGYRNVGIGGYALEDCTTGKANIAIGYRAGTSITTGYNNMCIGDGAFMRGIDSFNNTCTGIEAGLSIGHVATIRNVTAYGFHAAYGDDWDTGDPGDPNSVGSYSTWIGSDSGGLVRSDSTHQYTTALGAMAGYLGGANCLFLGYNAGRSCVTDNSFFLDALDRSGETNEQNKSLLWGKFNANQLLQTLQINATAIFPIGSRHKDGVKAYFGTDDDAFIQDTGTGFYVDSGSHTLFVTGVTYFKTGNIRVTPDSGDAYFYVIGAGSSGVYIKSEAAGACYFYNVSNGAMYFGTNNALRLTISATGVITAANLLVCNGNVGISQTSFGTSATKTLAISTGVAPSDSPADCTQLYSADESAGNACLHTRTEGGAVVKLFQGAAVADATDAASTMARLNDLLARMRANGLIAT